MIPSLFIMAITNPFKLQDLVSKKVYTNRKAFIRHLNVNHKFLKKKKKVLSFPGKNGIQISLKINFIRLSSPQ